MQRELKIRKGRVRHFYDISTFVRKEEKKGRKETKEGDAEGIIN